MPEGVTLEQVTEAAEKLLRERRNQYNRRHPEMVEQQRTRTYINFLKRHGYCVLDTRGLSDDVWAWDELTQRSIVNAVRAHVQEGVGKHE